MCTKTNVFETQLKVQLTFSYCVGCFYLPRIREYKASRSLVGHCCSLALYRGANLATPTDRFRACYKCA